MHRLIVTSHTYRQSSRSNNRQAILRDPNNLLCWRQNLRRLEAEVIRDSVLQTSGRLNLQMGGRGIFPLLAADVLASQSRPGNGWGKSSVADRSRRSVYIFIKRTLGVPFLEAFDVATPDSPIAARTTTTIAPQALILLNSQFMQEQSETFARRLNLKNDGSSDISKTLSRAIELALARDMTDRESDVLSKFFQRQRQRWQKSGKNEKDAKQLALVATCKVILNLNEFIYVD